MTSWLMMLGAEARDEDSSPPPHRGGEIVRGLPCVKRLQQGKINKVCSAKILILIRAVKTKES